MADQASLFDSALKPQHPTKRVENVGPNPYLGCSFGGRPITAVDSSPESVEAAVENMPNRATQRQRVLDHLTEWPSTDEQVQDALAMDPNTERPRRVELARAGLIKKVGTARTKAGRNAAVWGRA